MDKTEDSFKLILTLEGLQKELGPKVCDFFTLVKFEHG